MSNQEQYKPIPQILNSYPDYHEIMESIVKLDELNLSDTSILLDNFIEMQDYYLKEISKSTDSTESTGDMFFQQFIPFEDDYNKIRNRKTHLLNISNEKANKFHTSNLIINKNEKVNGYEMYMFEENIMEFKVFEDLWKKYSDYKQMKNIHFMEYIDYICSSKWSKMNQCGEQFGSINNENIQRMVRANNLNALRELPFPREVIIETIKMGRKNKMESVRYTNFICEWVRRKGIQVYGLNDNNRLHLKI
jgi:hypothetical protein